ncbi:MAG: hypothetical protein ACOYOT_06500 [Bacteroidales bacterium]
MMKLRNIVVCAVACLVSSCIQNEYDLSKGLNTEMLIGGDSLSMPVLSDSIILADVATDTNMFKTLDGDLSIVRRDSMSVKVDTIKAVVFDLTPPKIDTSEIKFTTIQLNPFQLTPFNYQSSLPIPDLDVRKSILPINISNLYSYPISTNKLNRLKRRVAKVSREIIDTISIASDSTIDSDLSLENYPIQLKQVNRILLGNRQVKIVFDRSLLSTLNLTSQFEKIALFRIDFPKEYHISNAVGSNARIESNSFIIENAILPQESQLSNYSFDVDYIDLSNTLQTNYLDFKKKIPYKFLYKFQGETNNIASLDGKSIEMMVKINSNPIVDDLLLETNSISIAASTGNYQINKVISTLPKEVESLSDITFKTGAYLQIVIDKPKISPFVFTSGFCEIQLPKLFKFKRALNLDLNSNVYKIPYSQLFKTHKLYLAGVNINQQFPATGGELVLNDNVTFTINDFKLAPTTVYSSQVEAMTNLKYNFNVSTNLINIENANLVTREILQKMPDRKMNIDIHRFVSNEVEKLYSTNMAKPVNLELKFDVFDVPSSVDSVFFRNYTIKLPSILRFKDGQTNYMNEIIINRGFKVSEGFSKVLELVKLDFGPEGKNLVDGYLDLSEIVTLTGSVYIKSLNLKSSELGAIKVLPKVNIDEVRLGLVEGKFNPVLSAINQKVNLNIPSYLLNDSVKLDITNPVILVEAGNPMGLPIEVELEMKPKRNGQVLTDAIIHTKINIAGTQNLGYLQWSKIGMAVNDSGVPGNYQPVIVPELANLLKTIPDEIEMKMQPRVVSDHHLIDLSAQKNQMEMRYEVRIPMTFGANFRFKATKTVTNLKERLTQILAYSKRINIATIIDNNIPLDLGVDIKPIDVDGNIIPDISISKLPSVKAGYNDYISHTRFVIDVQEKPNSNALFKLDGLLVTVSANRDRTTAGFPIRKTQYFKIDLKVIIPNGLTMNLGK